MKTKILIISLMFLSVVVFPNEYHKMITSKNHWNYIQKRYPTCIGCGGETKTHSYFISSDTIINGNTYQKVMCAEIRYNGIDTTFFCTAREDTVNQIVYLKYDNQNEKEIYSFKVDPGAILSLDSVYIGEKLATIIERHVKSVGSYDFNGFTGKKVAVATVTSYIDFVISSVEVWYEGIGSLDIFFGIGEDSGILCFWNDGIQFYSNPEEDGCVITEYIANTGIDQTAISPIIKLIPNPVKDILTIEPIEDFECADFYNLFGCKLISTSCNTIDISGFKDGVYLVKIKLKSGQIINEKIIKNR